MVVLRIMPVMLHLLRMVAVCVGSKIVSRPTYGEGLFLFYCCSRRLQDPSNPIRVAMSFNLAYVMVQMVQLVRYKLESTVGSPESRCPIISSMC